MSDAVLEGITKRIEAIDGNQLSVWRTAGYRLYPPPSVLSRHANALLQKSIRDESGKRLFFVNVWVYVYDGQYAGDTGPHRVSFMGEVQFNSHGDQSPTFEVKLHTATTPTETEAFFRRIYDAMNCGAYDDECYDPL